MPTAEKPAYRFGPFELVTSPPALHRDGKLVAITPKALATLIALVSRHGTPVGKEELLATIWSGTAVGEANLTQNVYTLRKVLAADFPDQNPIENIPRFGYRFSLAVREEARPVQEAEENSLSAVREIHAENAFKDSVSFRGLTKAHEIEPATGISESLATFPLNVQERTLSGHTAHRFPLRNAWMIAGGLCAVVALLLLLGYRHVGSEGPPRAYSMVQVTASDSNNPVTAAALSPDGAQIAYADDDGVMLRAQNGGLAHPMRSPDLYMVTRMAWFPDGLHLAVSGQDPKTHVQSVWSLSINGDVPALLRADGADALVSPEGKRIAFETPDGTEIWTSKSDGSEAQRLLKAEGTSLLSLLLWSKDGSELYVSQHAADHNAIHPGTLPRSGEFLAVDVASAKITSVERGSAFDEACALPGDGLLLSGNDGGYGLAATRLREVSVNPRTGAFRSAPRLIQTLSQDILALSSAQAGHTIDVVLSSGQADVYVATIDPHHAGLRDLRRLTYEVSASYPHSWTPDSRSVIFESRHFGLSQLYRQAIDAHNPTQLVSTPYDAAIPIITSDGKWIFFEGGDHPRYGQLLRVSSDGGTPARVTLTRGMGQFRCPLLRGSCVLRQTVQNDIVFSRLDPIRGEGKPFYTEARTPDDVNAFAISPNGMELASIRPAGSSSVIHVVRLDATDKIVASSEVTVDRPVETLQWSADGEGWFAQVASPTRSSLTARSLYFIERSGKKTLLTRSIGRVFGVPSPDGKKLAMVQATRDSNIWSLQ